MATAKTESTESTDTPKPHIITFAKGATAAEKMAALKAAQKELENAVLDELDAEEAGLQAKLDDVRKRRNAIVPPREENKHSAGRSRGPKKDKASGIQVSLKVLEERFKNAKDGKLNVRNEGLDLASVKKAVDESKGKYRIERTAPAWPLVVLA